MRHGKERGDYAAPLAFEGPLKGLKEERWPYSRAFEEMKVAKFVTGISAQTSQPYCWP